MKTSLAFLARKSALSLCVSTLMLGASAALAEAPVKVAGGILTGPNGMTLYTFDKDVAGSSKSMCNGPCAANWPPLMASATDQASGEFSVELGLDPANPQNVIRAALLRTARLIMRGEVMIPASVWKGKHK